MPKRGENVRKRKDGRWEGRYTVKDVCRGTTCVRSVYAKTYSEVRRKLANARESAQLMSEKEYSVKEEVEVDNVVARWFETIERTRKHSTCVKYKNIYYVYIQKIIGSVNINKLTQETINSIILDKPELSVSIRRSIICVTNMLLKYISSEYLTPVYKLENDMVKVSQTPVESLSESEQEKLVLYLQNNRDIYKIGIMLCLATGIRLGEVCALKWEDIDIKNGLLYVNRTVQRIAVTGGTNKTALVESEPKSFFSKRVIPLADSVIEWLQPYYREVGYVLSDNRPMEPRTYQNKYSRYLNAIEVKKNVFIYYATHLQLIV